MGLLRLVVGTRLLLKVEDWVCEAACLLMTLALGKTSLGVGDVAVGSVVLDLSYRACVRDNSESNS